MIVLGNGLNFASWYVLTLWKWTQNFIRFLTKTRPDLTLQYLAKLKIFKKKIWIFRLNSWFHNSYHCARKWLKFCKLIRFNFMKIKSKFHLFPSKNSSWFNFAISCKIKVFQKNNLILRLYSWFHKSTDFARIWLKFVSWYV